MKSELILHWRLAPRESQFLRNAMQQVHRALELKNSRFNACLMDDADIRRLNREFRGKDTPTDVLSFPWRNAGERVQTEGDGHFLGEIAISVEAAARNARQEDHSLLEELRWLILHGTLHLLGYDHERDHGEMNELELKLRERLDGNSRTCRRQEGSENLGVARRRAAAFTPSARRSSPWGERD